MKVQTPAKINTLLHILRRRHDGFHELYSHMVPVSIFDTLSVEKHSKGGIILELQGIKLQPPPENNLVMRAAKVFEEVCGFELNLHITLSKTIPVGAGLGGGSGNAAAMLVILNQIFEHPLTNDQLKTLATEIGADVPFFIDPCPSEVSGFGEVIESLSNYPLLPVLILKPPFSISTAEAYQNCCPRDLCTVPEVRNQKDLVENLVNRFEISLFQKFPRLEKLKNLLIQHGAIGASVSGSGSALFGLFESETSKLDAARRLKRRQSLEVFPCKMLEKHLYDPL